MSNNELEAKDQNLVEGIVGYVTQNTLDVSFANQMLISSLVKQLIDKGVLDRDEYLENNKTDEANILKYLEESDESDDDNIDIKKRMLANVFSMHRNDFIKPE